MLYFPINIAYNVNLGGKVENCIFSFLKVTPAINFSSCLFIIQIHSDGGTIDVLEIVGIYMQIQLKSGSSIKLGNLSR